MHTFRLFLLFSRKIFCNLFSNKVKLTAGNIISTRKITSQVIENQTAGLVVIGDEILKGQVVDTNTHFIAKGLYELGVKLVKASIVGDNVEEISREVKTFSKKFNYVITTGGIGPTHDDVTYEAIAHAFEEPLVAHPELVKVCQDFFKTYDLSAPALKLAHIPKSGILNYGYDKKTGIRTLYPTVSVRNVYIFPGVSQLMKYSFTLLSEDLFGKGNAKFYMKELYLYARETDIADNLNQTVNEYPSVTFGSYPNLFNSYYGVMLTVESVDEHLMEEAYQKLKSLLPEDLIVNYDSDPVNQSYTKIEGLMNGIIPARQEFGTTIKECIKDSLNILEECVRRYSPNEVSVCFSGGKESTVLLHLWNAILSKHHESSDKPLIQAMRVVEENSFHEIETYIKEISERYKMDLITIKGTLKSGLKEYLSLRPNIKALIIGNRIGDPGCENLKSFMETDSEWPCIVRVQPLCRWSYADVWNFLLSLYLPYCSLYDLGYTSLGSPVNTLPNPKLAANEKIYIIGVRRGSTHYPAYKLTDWNAERLGRMSEHITTT